MSNQRRQFLGLAAGAIAVPATSSLVVAQGNPARGNEAPIHRHRRFRRGFCGSS
jgi:hypothetical protein